MRCCALAPLLEVSDCTVRRGAFTVRLPALRLDAGRVAALYGPSGTGKSTLLAALFGLQGRGAEVGGAISWRGDAWRAMVPARQRRTLRREIAFLAQDPRAALDPLVRVGAQIRAATGRSPQDVTAELERLRVADAAALCHRWPHEVSGGEAQRALLAIAFLRRPALLVADEPTAGLDPAACTELGEHLRALVAGGAAVLLATHDPRLVHDLGAAVLVCRDGAFVPGGIDAAPWPGGGRENDVGTVPVIAAAGLEVAFAGRTVLRGVDLSVRRGEIVALVGASGAGKTTLLRALAGQLRPLRGTVTRPARMHAVQLVPQDAFGSLTPGRSVADLVAETAAGDDVGPVAARLQLDDATLTRTARSLSGGERRRAALLRALTVRPDVLLLDEPTAGLDRATAIAAMQAVRALQRERGLAIVLVTHDHELARAVAHRVVPLREGMLCES